jgi:hypothetical protein
MALNRIALVGIVLGVAGVSACTSIRRVQPTEYLADNAPHLVWVTYGDNSIVPLADPEIRRDTLRGLLEGKRERVKIPLGQVRSVEAKVPNHTKTALLLGGLGVAAVSSVYFLLISQAGSNGVGESVYCGTDTRGRPLGYC